MKAVTWQAKRRVSVDSVPDPTIQEPTDAIVRITSTNICGSDLHLYETLTAFMEAGDILGHEPIGIVEEVGNEVTAIKPGDRVVIPFQMSCGHCFMCHENLFSQCETTQVKDQGNGAALFGFSKLYGEVPGGQAEYLRVPQAQTTHIKVPEGPADDRFVYLSDVLPTAWQAVEYAAIPKGGTVVVLGLGPIGDMASRIAQHHGARVVAVDLVPERLQRARDRGIEVIDLTDHEDDLGTFVRDQTSGRGPDSVIDAVGMEAHGSPAAKLLQGVTALLPDAVGAPLAKKAGIDRLAACSRRSTSCVAAAPSRSSGSTAEQRIRFPWSRCSTSRYNFVWVRRTSCGGSTTSCLCSWMRTRWAWTRSRRTIFRWRMRRTPMKSSRRRRKGRSRSSSIPSREGGRVLRRVSAARPGVPPWHVAPPAAESKCPSSSCSGSLQRAVHRMTEMSSASGISPMITSTSDWLVDDALASAARPPSPAEIEPSSAAVSRSSPGDAFCKASPTWPGSDAGTASSERGVSPCDTGSSATVCGGSLVMTENYPLGQN